MLYEVTTWDPELQEWTPQIGIPPSPFTKERMITEIIPLLRELGYPVDGDDWTDDSCSPCLSIREAGDALIGKA